jgi:hypothetical protein
VTGLIPSNGLQLNPEAAHPPFAWQVALPSDWAMLDTHPSSWQRSLDRLVDDRFAGQRLKAAERRELFAVLADLVATCQRAGTLLSLVQLGRLSSGGVASAGIHLAWYDSAPDPASLATVRQALSRQGTVEEVPVPGGVALLQRDHLSMVPSGTTTRVGLTSFQAFLPLSGTTWTVAVATAGAQPDLLPMLRELVVAVVSSIRPLDGPADRTGHTTPTAPPGPDYLPVAPPDSAGIERGFGTLLPHTIDPRQADRDQADRD